MTEEKMELKLQLESKFKGGVGWFYWIAALSLINTISHLLNYNGVFVSGLGITRVIDLVASIFSEATDLNMFIYIALVINFSLIGSFVLMGVFANKGVKWVIILGMILYGLDTIIIFIFFKEFISIAFHVWALYGMYSGLKAYNKLQQLESELSNEQNNPFNYEVAELEPTVE